ncbi:hypothetical protein JTE90_014849 [Oedothorax gibbosus]|uniref:Uncharacterized protein n=1 Tax=Oedothorax gibbosus TaxID=931172 RepID=A0AAV6U191_9ARAC|nr:hypothetical protein JTE90_014849 [Oedothorax gibbosus]
MNERSDYISSSFKYLGTVFNPLTWWNFHFIHKSLQPEFFFKPKAAPYGRLYVHSPKQAFRRDDKSLILKGGKAYEMSIRLVSWLSSCLVESTFTESQPL